MTYNLSRLGFLAVVAGIWACGEAAAASTESGGARTELSPRERTIVVGRVSTDPKKTYPRVEKLANYLARRLEPLGPE